MSGNKVNQRIEELVAKWRGNRLSSEEKAELDNWYASFDDSMLIADSDESVDQLKQRLYASIADRMRRDPIGAGEAGLAASFEEDVPRRLRRLWPRYAVAAAMVLLVAGVWLLLYKKPGASLDGLAGKDIPPGGNKAILTLASGQRIVLSDAQNGKLAEQQSSLIEKTDSGSIRYVGGQGASAAAIAINTITTPRGGQYSVTLSDGTKVVLNASSSLKYPAVFTGSNRSVQLTGEAWFDVAQDKQHPFRVSTPDQELDVLGTEFNINAYDDEPGTKTTLLAGSVNIIDNTSHRSGLLKPGQQSILNDHNLSFSEADTEAAIAWKNGYFMFHSEDISSIMRRLARWYDVDIVYDGPRPTDQFNGSVERLSNISQVLKKLELTNKVHFTIEGRTISVRK